MSWKVCAARSAVVMSCALSASSAIAGVFETYGNAYQPIALPAPTGGGVVGDVLPDGRILALTETQLHVETAPGSGVFSAVAQLDAALTNGSVFPQFVRVSPSGDRLAIGAGSGAPVFVTDLSTALSPGGTLGAGNSDVFDVGHFDAAWKDDGSLAITAGDFGSPAVVTLLDVASDPMAPVNPVIINNIGGASGGIAFDNAGRLFTGNGFDLGPGGSDTGFIKAFDPGLWSGGPADFEAQGTLVADVLSANALGFDTDGNFFVGGGDFFGGSGDFGYMGVISNAALNAALLSGSPIDPMDPAALRRLDPRGDGQGFFGSAFDPLTGRLFVTDGATWYATIPAPGMVGLAPLAALWASRRRRSDSA